MDNNSNDKIFGRNAVLEALAANRRIDRLYLQDGLRGGDIAKIKALAAERKISPTFVPRAKLDELSGGGAHQGVVALVGAYEYSTVEEILDYAEKKGEPPFIVIAENLSDPHNLGSIIRTVNACGAHGVIIPKNRSVSVNSTVAKTSAGASEYTRVARVTNIARTIEFLKKRGVWIVGTDLSATQYHFECDLSEAVAVVIGSESAGISRLTRESCDFLVKIPMLGETQSLNASVAAGVILYEITRRRISG